MRPEDLACVCRQTWEFSRHSLFSTFSTHFFRLFLQQFGNIGGLITRTHIVRRHWFSFRVKLFVYSLTSACRYPINSAILLFLRFFLLLLEVLRHFLPIHMNHFLAWRCCFSCCCSFLLGFSISTKVEHERRYTHSLHYRSLCCVCDFLANLPGRTPGSATLHYTLHSKHQLQRRVLVCSSSRLSRNSCVRFMPTST